MYNIQEDLESLLNYSELYGKWCTVWYLPTTMSRKWKKASMEVKLCSDNYKDIDTLKKQEGWFMVTWVESGVDLNKCQGFGKRR